MLAAERGVAKNTLLAYRSDLSAASDMLAGKLAAAGKDTLSILTAGWSHLANSSIARKAAALRGFFGISTVICLLLVTFASQWFWVALPFVLTFLVRALRVI